MRGTVVLIHGFGEDHHIWDPLLPYLPEGFQYLIPDLPGSGKEPLPDTWQADPSIDQLAYFISHLLELKSKTGKVTLIGHSMGGYVALAFAEKYPEKVQALMLFHSTAFADSTEKKELRAKSIRFIQEHGAAAFIAQTTPNLFSEAYRQNNPEKLAGTIAFYSNFSPDALVWYTAAMMNRPEHLEVIRKADFPVGFVIGMLDKAVDPQQALSLVPLPAISHVQVLENAAHMGMLEATAETGPFLEKFLLECEMLLRD